jgi:hypothetical protein
MFKTFFYPQFFPDRPKYVKLFIKSGISGSIVSDYGLDDRDSILDRGRGFFF